MIERRLRALIALLLVLFATIATPARADNVADEADAQFQLGSDKYQAGDYKAALAHFLASNRLVPNRNVIFNIARTYEQLKQGPDAYRYYLLAGEGETDAGAKSRVEEALARIRPSVAVLTVTTTPPGADIFIDRRDLGSRGTTPRSLGLGGGKVKLVLVLPGHVPIETDAIDLKVGEETKLSFTFKPILGNVKIEGDPKGISVRVDRIDAAPVGTAPGVVAVPPGKHTLYLDKEGYQTLDLPIDVPENETITVRARLLPRTGSLIVNTDVKGALITIDDEPSGFAPAVVAVPVGKHKVKISQSGFRTYEKEIAIKENEKLRVDAELSQLDEVTAVSRQVETVEDAPASVSILPSLELRGMAYPTVAEAVRGTRGLYLSDDRSYPTVGFRGFSRPGDYGNRVLVLVDGHTANDNYIWSSYVGFDGRVDIEDVDHIEIVRGPGSVLYGTSAVFGVINLVTRDRNQPTHTELGVSVVEYGVGRARAHQTIKFTDDAGLWISVAGAHASGRDFYFSEYDNDPNDPECDIDARGRCADGNARNIDGFDAGMITGRIWWKSLTLQWFFNHRNKQLPAAEYDTIFGDGRSRFIDTRAFVEARFEPKLSDEVTLLTRLHGNLYHFDGELPYPAADGGLEEDVYRGRWAGVEQRAVFTPIPELRITVGGEFQYHFSTEQSGTDEAGNVYVTDDDGSPGRNDPFVVAAGYALVDANPAKWVKLSAGARIDYYSSIDPFDVVDAINPRFAAIFKPYDGGNLKVMAGKAFRAPSVYELYYQSPTQIRSEGLDSEQILSGEVEYSHRFSTTVTGTLAGFVNYVTNLVELRDAPNDTVQYTNSEAPVLVAGGEAEVRRDWRSGWMIAASYSFQRALYVDEADDRREVPNSPQHLGSVKGAVPIIGRNLQATSRLTFEGPRFDRNDRAGDPRQSRTDAGLIWDVVLSGEAENMGLRYALGVYNVMDWTYQAIPSAEFRQQQMVQAGRTFLASATGSF